MSHSDDVSYPAPWYGYVSEWFHALRRHARSIFANHRGFWQCWNITFLAQSSFFAGSHLERGLYVQATAHAAMAGLFAGMLYFQRRMEIQQIKFTERLRASTNWSDPRDHAAPLLSGGVGIWVQGWNHTPPVPPPNPPTPPPNRQVP